MANRVPLIDGYEVEYVSEDVFLPYFRANRARMFAGETFLDIDRLLDDEEKAARAGLASRRGDRYRLHAFVRKGDEVAGWTWGAQMDAESFLMINTGLWPEHRRRGIYTALLPWVLAQAREQGFQIVTSRHHATNSAVIIPKLKAGFLITAFEMTDRFGLVLHLNRYFNPARERIIRWRTGTVPADESIRQLLPPEP